MFDGINRYITDYFHRGGNMDHQKYDALIVKRIERNLDAILPIAVVISFLGSFISYINSGLDPFVFFDAAFGIIILGVYLLRNAISVKLKIGILIVFTFTMGMLGVLYSGFISSGILMLSISSLVAVAFVKRTIGMVYSLGVVLIFSAFPVAVHYGLLTFSGENANYLNNPSNWYIHIIVFATLCFVNIIVVNSIKQYLTQSIYEAESHLEKISTLAYYDPLTGLPNKNKFIETLDALKLETGWLILFNIRGLNLINSIYGSDIGDKVIRHMSALLDQSKREGEHVAKIGGNELVWFCNSTSREELAHRIAIFTEAVNELSHEQLPTKLHFNAGYVQIEHGYGNIAEMLQKASMALEQAKAQKKHNIMSYDMQFEERFRTEEAIKNLLSQAIENQEFYISYQEKLDCKMDRTVGVEALARWQSGMLGNVAPNIFIPIIEKANLSVTFGMMIIQMVLDEYHKLVENYDSEITVSINISPTHLASPDFADYVIEETAKRHIHPKFITFEITEDSLIENIDVVAEVLFRLRDHGFKISLDDFGTGYSSLSYLSHLGFDELKIDRSFIQKLNEDEKTGTLIRTIINLKDTYGISIVAEGVETQEQSDLLIDYGCNVHQGYLFSKPKRLD